MHVRTQLVKLHFWKERPGVSDAFASLNLWVDGIVFVDLAMVELMQGL